MAKKLTAMEKAIRATKADMKKHETVKVYVGRSFTTDDCADLVAPLSKPEIDMIRKSVAFIKNNETVKCVYMDIRNPHVCDDLEAVISDDDDFDEHEQNNWSIIPVTTFNEKYTEFTQCDEVCRLKIWVGDDDGLTYVTLIVGYEDDEANAMMANVFIGKQF